MQEIDQLEIQVGDIEKKIVQMNGSAETLTKRHAELLEMHHVLEESSAFLSEAHRNSSKNEETESFLDHSKDADYRDSVVGATQYLYFYLFKICYWNNSAQSGGQF
jgi:hypothetical protein